MKLREINLVRTLPVTLALSFAVGSVIDWFDADLIGGKPGRAALVGGIVTAVVCVLVRLGRLPWFEMKDGKKHKFVVWLEDRLPFLRADFYSR